MDTGYRYTQGMKTDPNDIEFGVAIAGIQNQGAGKESIWTYWGKNRARIVDRSDPSAGNGFGQHFREDIGLAADMGMSMFRFSIDWSRVEPKKGEIDEKYVQFCKAVVAEINKRGMKVIITLFHFDYPQWFEELGGFTKKKNLIHFLQYVKNVVPQFTGTVYAWIILNEPSTWIFQSYIYGIFPPGEKNKIIKALRTLDAFSHAHNQAYEYIKNHDRNAKVGSSSNLCRFLPYNENSFVERLACSLVNWLWNYRFINKTYHRSDFIGVQYYNRVKIRKLLNGNIAGILQEYGVTRTAGETEVSDIGWDIEPTGLSFFMNELWKRYRRPLFITESGVADAGISSETGIFDDRKRQQHIKDTIEAVRKANQSGIDIMGVLWWTLVDNWEWPLGFTAKFGFYSQESEGKRVARKSVSIMKSLLGPKHSHVL
jgi:beta-glucosidase